MADQKNQKNNYILDKRQTEDMVEQMRHLAASYTPEWKLDSADPDPAAVIGILYAGMLKDNVDRINQTIDRYHTEFVNLLDITAKPAIPAKSVVIMNLSADTIPGAEVPAGSKLWVGGAPEEVAEMPEEDLIFETVDPIYVTRATVRDVYMTDYEKGQIFPLLGDFTVPQLLYPAPGSYNSSSDEEESIRNETELGEPSIEQVIKENPGDSYPMDPEEEYEEKRLRPFTLYGESGGIQQNVCLMYHRNIFKNADNNIYIRFCDAEALNRKIMDGTMVFKYPYENELIPVEEVSLLEDGETWVLRKQNDGDIQLIAGRNVGLIALESTEAVVSDYIAEKIEISAVGDAREPEFAGNDQQEFNVTDFLPFTETLSLYKEAYIGMDDYFSQSGAEIHMNFKMLFGEHLVRLTAEEEGSQLKIIKRKSKSATALPTAYVRADQITMEYFNGTGWKKIPFKKDVTQIFAMAEGCEMDLYFNCPDDWTPSSTGPYTGRMIRMQILQAENCYFRPAIHYFPRIRDLNISFSYSRRGTIPELLSVAAGSKKLNMTSVMKNKKPISVFLPTGYTEDALYIGLSEKPERGPVGLFIHLQDKTRFERLPVYFQYSTRKGFKPLDVLDATDNLTHSGLVYFIPPADFYPVTLEGKRDCWIRVIRRESEQGNERNIRPRIEDIRMNGVRVHNVDTMDEIDFFLNELTPGITFALNRSNILDVDVWVNETGHYSIQQMKLLLREDHGKYRAEYDLNGEIIGFYVRWEETDSLGPNAPWKSYVLDRLQSLLIFGDGLTNDVPRVIDDVAVKVTCRRSLGKLANVSAGSINSSLWNFDYVTNIYNPISAAGGSAMENVERALERGSNLISTRKRLVSEKDYLREILSYSDGIEQVRMVSGLDPDNREIPGALSFVILMKNYQQGSYFFHQLSEPLRKHLLKRAEMTVQSELLYITEPVFVDISVTMWVRNMKMEDSLDLLHEMNDILEDYLSPVPSGRDQGWAIGTLPTESQIQLRLGSLKNRIVINTLSITASWDDEEGSHEKELRDLTVTPFMIPRNGVHRIEK